MVFLGTLARHLPPEDPKRSAIVQTLLDVLGTPSESVQRSVSTCLAPLIQVWTWVWDKGIVGGLCEESCQVHVKLREKDAAFACQGTA